MSPVVVCVYLVIWYFVAVRLFAGCIPYGRPFLPVDLQRSLVSVVSVSEESSERVAVGDLTLRLAIRDASIAPSQLYVCVAFKGVAKEAWSPLERRQIFFHLLSCSGGTANTLSEQKRLTSAVDVLALRWSTRKAIVVFGQVRGY